MKKIIQFGLLGCVVALLTSCTTTYNRNSMIERVITDHQLKNGKVLKIGFRNPDPSWGCRMVAQESHNWAMEKFTGVVKLGGGKKLQDRAIAYANSHSNENINYAFLFIPNEKEIPIIGINAGIRDKAYITYYSCQCPPAKHYNPFRN